MINNLDDFKKVIFNSIDYKTKNTDDRDIFGEMYCPKCGGIRRIKIFLMYLPLHKQGTNLTTLISNYKSTSHRANAEEEAFQILEQFLSPSLWNFQCLQCQTNFTTLIYNYYQGQEMVVLPSCTGGLCTPNTPDSVTYYLDQAYKAKSIGANSASMAMYRGAIEQILFNKGYTRKMLGNKIIDLIQDIKNNKAPDWAIKLETRFLDYLNKLGNSSIHPNDGDIEKQKVFDSELLSQVDEVILTLLFKIYEAPLKTNSLLESFQKKLDILDK